MSDPIRITADELNAPEVDDYVELHSYLDRNIGEVNEQSWVVKVIYANWFYLSVACTIGALCAWAVVEPFFDDNDLEASLGSFLMFPVAAAGIGLFLGAAEGAMCRNFVRALKAGAIGLGVGFVGGLVFQFPAGIVFALMTAVAVAFWDNPAPDAMPTGVALLIFMMGRAMAWAVVAVPAGVGQGIALREKKVIINGLVGALLGGLIGGLLFDPISFYFVTEDGQATYSRAIGFAVIGMFVGLFVGLVEGWTKTAWMLMKQGPLAGKQFIMFKDTTVIGSSPKADIYIFKDDAIEPRHALIINRGGRFEIEDCQTPDGTYVNGIPVTRQVLQSGDQVVLGKTVLEFALRDSVQD